MWSEILGAAFSIFFAHTLSLRVGNGTLTAVDASGSPAHLTVASVFAAAALIESGKSGSVASGDLTLTYTPFPPAGGAEPVDPAAP